MAEIEYTRWPNCSCVYSIDLEECPKCGAKTVINESVDNSKVFNIND